MPRDLLAQPRDLLAEPEPEFGSFTQEARGLGEAALQLGTGAVATPVAGLVGIADFLTSNGSAMERGRSMVDTIENVQESMTFQPRTRIGQRTSDAIARPFEALSDFAHEAGRATGGDDTILGNALVESVIELAPGALGIRGRPGVRGGLMGETRTPRLNPSQQILERGQAEGYVTLPSQTTRSGAAQVLEGVGGKIKTQQMASQRNQPVTNNLATRALGLPEGTPLSPDVTRLVRSQAQPIYTRVRGAGRVELGGPSQFRASIDDAVSDFRQVAGELPELVDRQVLKFADDLGSAQSLDSATMVSSIRLFRQKSSKAYRDGESGLGRAYTDMAGALEDALESHLSASGNPNLLNQFRRAREQIAKSHSVENALVNGNVNAHNLASQMGRGRPLSGELQQIAEFATEFPKVTRLTNEALPAISPLDTAVAAGSIGAAVGSSNPAFAIPAIAAAARPGARAITLGPGQRLGLPSAPTNALAPSLAGSGNALLVEDDIR